MLHKRQSHILQKIHKTLIQHSIIKTKANKSRTVVVIDKDTYKKVKTFLQEINFIKIYNDP
jgi:hypothetical protein